MNPDTQLSNTPPTPDNTPRSESPQSVPPQTDSTPSSQVSPVSPEGPAPFTPLTPVNEPQPPVPPAGPEGPQPPLPPTPVPPRKNNTLLIVIIVIVIVAVLGIATFLAMMLLNKSTPNSSTSNTSSQTSGAVDVSTLTSAVLSTPESATKGLTKSPAGKNPNAVGYTTADQSCLVAYGTATSDLVADKTVNDFVNSYLKTVTQDSSTTVTGPAVAADRMLTDASDSNKKYSVPTMHFELSDGAKHGTGLYSLALLKNNSRLIIETLCINEQGSVSQAQMDSMEAIVKQITVKAN